MPLSREFPAYISLHSIYPRTCYVAEAIFQKIAKGLLQNVYVCTCELINISFLYNEYVSFTGTVIIHIPYSYICVLNQNLLKYKIKIIVFWFNGQWNLVFNGLFTFLNQIVVASTTIYALPTTCVNEILKCDFKWVVRVLTKYFSNGQSSSTPPILIIYYMLKDDVSSHLKRNCGSNRMSFIWMDNEIL